MKRLALLAALAFLPASLARADGCPPSTCGTSTNAVPGSRYVTLRTNGQHGPLVVYDVVARRQRVQLPAGVASADGRTFVSARAPKRAAATSLTRYRLPSGRRAGVARVPGRYAVAGVSARGRRIVLLDLEARRGETRFVVLDGWRRVDDVTLKGFYELETLSSDGERLFLVHWRKNGYDLELFHLRTNRLRPTPTRSSEDGKPETMAGQAWTAVATRDGSWLLTLYLKRANEGFVHALDLRRGVGHCIDLPFRGVSTALGASALALSPDERRLYVANPILGRVYVVDVRRPALVRTSAFRERIPLDRFAFGIGPNGAVSPDGRTVYFSANRSLWAFDVPRARVRGPYRVGAFVAGLAFTPDGRRVVAFDRRTSSVFDAATGKMLAA